MFIALLPLIIKVATLLIDYLIKRKEISEESRKIFILAREQLRIISQKNMQNIYEQEFQIEEINRAWEEKTKKKNL